MLTCPKCSDDKRKPFHRTEKAHMASCFQFVSLLHFVLLCISCSFFVVNFLNFQLVNVVKYNDKKFYFLETKHWTSLLTFHRESFKELFCSRYIILNLLQYFSTNVYKFQVEKSLPEIYYASLGAFSCGSTCFAVYKPQLGLSEIFYFWQFKVTVYWKSLKCFIAYNLRIY